MSIAKGNKVNLFERVVSSKGGREKLRLTEPQIKSVISTLIANNDFVDLVKEYQTGLTIPTSLSEEEEVSLRQKIFPTIDCELRKIDPRYQIFSPGVLERLLEIVLKED